MIDKITIDKRSVVIRNICIFVFLTPLLGHILLSITEGKSAFNLPGILGYGQGYIPFTILCAILLALIWNIKKASKSLFILFLAGHFVLFLYFFSLSYEKTVLILSFFYLIIGYNYFLLLEREFEDVVYVPGYKDNFLDIENLEQINIVLTHNNIVYKGSLTNWSAKSFFIYIKSMELSSLRGIVDYEVTFEGNKFIGKGIIATRTKSGLGIRHDNKNKSHLYSWYDLYSILKDRGFKPLFLN